MTDKKKLKRLPLTPETAGSYMANLVPTKAPVTSAPVVIEPKVTASEITGGEGGNGSGKIELKYPTYQSYQDYVNGRESSILEAYDAAKKYAEDTKNSAYASADDAYRIAEREAQGNFRANQPTYGVAAEQMLSSGLTGSGYSDYLAGKAYEARVDEINAARSQMNYAKQLADQQYNADMYNANTDKISLMDELGEFKFSYSAQLNEAYKAKIDELVQGIMDGKYDADVAAKILRNYTTDGQLSDDVLAILKSTEDNYWKANNASMKSAFLDSMWANLQAGNPVTEASARQWLIDNVKGITEDEIAAYMDGYFKDGKLDKNALADAINSQPQTGNNNSTSGSGATVNSGGSSNLNDELSEKNNVYNYEDTIDAFKSVMLDHDIGNGEAYGAELSTLMNNLASNGGVFDDDAAQKIYRMVNGLALSSGTFEGNKGWQKSFQEGDNFTVSLQHISYRVESQGVASDKVVAAARGIADGAVFGYGSELYLKVGDSAYKIGPRPGIGNKDYDKLWRAVYSEQLNDIKYGIGPRTNEGKETTTQTYAQSARENKQSANISAAQKLKGFSDSIKTWYDETNQEIQDGIDNALNKLSPPRKEDDENTEKKENIFTKAIDALRSIRIGSKAGMRPWKNEATDDTGPREITRGVASYERDGLFDRGLTKGDNFTVEVANKSYKVESGGEVTYDDVINAAEEAGVYNGEVFTYGDDIYIKRGDKYYSVDQRFFMPNQDDELRIAIQKNTGAVADESSRTIQSGVFLGENKEFDSMDKIDVTDLDGNEYRLQVRAVLGSDSSAYKAGRNVDDGEAFIHGRDIYVKDGEKVYKLAAVGGRKNGDYDKLVEKLKSDRDPTTATYKTQNVVVANKGKIGNATLPHTNYTADRNGNIEPKKQIKVSIGNNNYWVKTEETTTGGAYRVARSMGATAGEIFSWNGNLYMYLGDGAVRLGDADLGPGSSYLGYNELYEVINEGITEDLTSYSRYLKRTT